MRNGARLAGGTGALVLLLGLVLVGVPFMTRARDAPESVPQPPPLLRVATVTVPAGSRACWGPVVVDRRSERALLRVSTAGGPGPPLVMTLRGAGYRARRALAGGYADNSTLSVAVAPPRREVATIACVRNAGRRAILLFAADDRTKAPYPTHVAGRTVRAVPQLAFYERTPHSIAARLASTFHHMGAFRPGVVGPWLLWPLAFLLVIGVPAGVLWAHVTAASDGRMSVADTDVKGLERRPFGGTRRGPGRDKCERGGP